MFKRYFYEQQCTNKLDNLEEMAKFLQTYNLSKVSHELIENMNKTNDKQGDCI